jgi:hypothetical protein
MEQVNLGVVADECSEQVRELGELELALIGGGQGDISLGGQQR